MLRTMLHYDIFTGEASGLIEIPVISIPLGYKYMNKTGTLIQLTVLTEFDMK
jgi:hypothetical protein